MSDSFTIPAYAVPAYTPPDAGANGVGNALGIISTRNLSAAHAEMNLSPQEQALYQHHLSNLHKGGVVNEDGSMSTILSVGFEKNGRYYVVPSIYGNAKLRPDDAVARAEQIGLSKFPSYENEFSGENRYQRLHNYMEADTADVLTNIRAQAAMASISGTAP